MTDSYFVTRLSWEALDPFNASSLTFILQTIWNQNEICLALFDLSTDSSYTGTMPHAQLSATAQQLEIPFDEFLIETKSVLTQSEGTNDSFNFELNNSTFIWRKRLSDKLKIIYGSVVLGAVSSADVRNDILIRALDIQLTQRNTLASTAGDTEMLRKDNDVLRGELERCLSEKSDLERKLLRQFAALLNTKKQRIVELEEELSAKQKDIDQLKILNSCKTKSKNRKSTPAVTAAAATSDSSDESDIEYRSRASADSQLKRLHSDSSQSQSQDSVAILPKRVRGSVALTTRVSFEDENEEVPSNIVQVGKRPVVVLEESPKQSSESFECDTQVMIEDM